MASNQPAWKHTSAKQSPAAESGPSWRNGNAAPVRVPLLPRRRLLVGATWFLFLAFCASLVWVATWISPPRTVAVFLIGAHYADNPIFPANSAGQGMLRDLASDMRNPALRNSQLLRLVQDRIHEVRADAPWDAGLESFGESTLMMVVSMHGSVDEKGPFLLATNADARPNIPLQRLRMETVFKRLERIAGNVKIVLVLDVTQLSAHWPLGMLHNDFARSLQALEARIEKIPNLVVIVSSGPDERSWTSQDWGETIFGHYVGEGLRGGADLDDNQKITALELYQYTRAKVSAWTRFNRAAEQQPMLLPAKSGEERARAIVLNSATRHFEERNPEQLPQPLFAPEVKAAWHTWQELADASPPPYVHAPHAWQQYQSTLLQYESALRFGDTVAAKKKQERLLALRKTISNAGQLQLRSADATLAMHAVTGPAGRKIDEPTEAVLKQFWDAWTDEDAKSVLDEAKKKLWKERPVPVRELANWLLERAAVEKLPGLARAAKRLQAVRSADRPLPAEAHWLVMLQRDLPPTAAKEPETTELFALALEVRRLAEQAAVGLGKEKYAYSEQVYPWIAGALTQADQQRQFGQDLMLSSQKSDWQQARALLTQAKKSYQGVSAQGEIVRRALAARDQALAILPAYSHWLAERPAYVLAKPPVNDPNLDAKVQQLWQDLHALGQRLERPDVKGDVANLPDLTRTVVQKLTDLEQRFSLYLESLLGQSVVENEHKRCVWLETEAALRVPQPDLERRMNLLARQHLQSRNLLIFGNMQKKVTGLPADYAEAVKKQARKQGDMALALLGQKWFDRFTAGKEENFVQVQHRLEKAVVEEKWQDTLLLAGKRIGQGTRRLPLEIQRLLTPGSKDEKAAPPQFALGAADLLARRMEATLNMPEGLDPVSDYRKLELGKFLIGQAQRTYLDHWYDDNPGAEPYYRVAARAFLADAFLPAGKREPWTVALKQSISDWDKKLERSDELAVRDTTDQTGSGVAKVTSEQEWDREYRIVARPEDEIPAGFPTLWLEDSSNLRVTEPAAGQRIALPLTFNAKEQDKAFVRFKLMSPLVVQAEKKDDPQAYATKAPLKVRGLFRGHFLGLESPVDVYPEPTMIIREFPLPRKASVAVRTDKTITVRAGSNNSGVAFVLDCSGSMRPPPNADYRLGRYYQAVEALKVVLQKIPKGTTVSVLTFGQAVGAGRTAGRPEDSITHAIEPTLWNPQDPKQLESVIGTLHAMEPWNKSPIIRTILQARADIMALPGTKTVVAITDGHDNCFEKDIGLVKEFGDIPNALRKSFDKNDISLHMVFFPPLDEEERNAQPMFGLIEKFHPPGKVHRIEDIGKLAILLEAVMRQRLNYWVDRTGQNVTVNEIPESGLDVSTSDKNDRWYGKGLPPGGHKVRVNVPDRVEKNVLLHRGDLLLMDLVETPKGMMFERYLFSDDYPWKRRVDNPAKDWRLTVLQDQALDKNGLQMLVSLEKTVDRRETILEQIKPREAWLELHLPPEVSTNFSMRWSLLSGYPAPAWSIDVPTWPTYARTTTPARPVLNVWWNPDEEARSAAELAITPLLKERQRPVIVQNEKDVIIESAAIEKHRVEVQRGVFEERNCLVIRLRHELGRPILTRIQAAEIAGAEHRFYSKAGKYTALYWFANDKDAVPLLARLRIISVSAFKEEAQRRGYAVQMRDLTPEPTDVRPRPPIELK